jgi:hypothetical protein
VASTPRRAELDSRLEEGTPRARMLARRNPNWIQNAPS